MEEEKIPKWSQVRIFSKHYAINWYHSILKGIVSPFSRSVQNQKYYFSRYCCNLAQDPHDTKTESFPKECEFTKEKITLSVRLRFQSSKLRVKKLKDILKENEDKIWYSDIRNYEYIDSFSELRFSKEKRIDRANLVCNLFCANSKLVLDYAENECFEPSVHNLNQLTGFYSQSILHMVSNPQYSLSDQSGLVPLHWKARDGKYYPIAQY